MIDRGGRQKSLSRDQAREACVPHRRHLLFLACLFGVVGSIAIGMLAPGSAGAGPAPIDCPDLLPAGTPAASTSLEGAPSDLAFLDAMIQQDAEAIGLAGQALQYAQDSRVKRLGLRVAESQATELQLLRSWRLVWFPEAAPAGIATSSTARPSCVSEQFDRQILSQLLSNFQFSIELATRAEREATHAELRDFASSVVRARTGELTTIRALLGDPGSKLPVP